jgi:ribosomal protein S18 acetylase RimI-like enzyme
MTNSSTTSLVPRSKAEIFRDIVHPADVDAVERLVRKTGVFSVSEIAIARELVEENLAKGADLCGYHFLIADGVQGIDGYTCFGPISGTHARYELYWIAVDPAARRLGLGSRLQIATEVRVKAMGGKMLIAETSTTPHYAAARGFYLSQGYALLAEVPDWHDDGDGLAIFGKRL